MRSLMDCWEGAGLIGWRARFYVGSVPQRLKPRLILQDFRRGWKPLPFKT